VTPNNRLHLTGYSGLRPLPPAGDARWYDLRDARHAAVRRELAICRGQEVDTAGDGFYAAFDGPARA